jgi:heat shock protein HtpX
MLKRFGFFGLVNFLIISLLSLVTHWLGFDKELLVNGISYTNMLLFCLVWGMGGAFISLLISKWMAKVSMGVYRVEKREDYKYLVDMVYTISKKAGLEEMPEVGVYTSNELNAFATGPSKNNSLVAFSTGLLTSMNRDELEGVIAHEVSHIANGDMVTMTLIQGVMNAFVMFLARAVAQMVINQIKKDSKVGSVFGTFIYMAIVLTLQMVFGMFASLVVNWFSRDREYRADHGAVDLSSKESMIAALRRLEQNYGIMSGQDNKGIACMQISTKGKFFGLFSSHPELSDRIKTLQNLN